MQTITDYKTVLSPPTHIPLVVVLTYGNESKCNRHNYKHCVQATISVSSKQTCNQKTPIEEGKKRADGSWDELGLGRSFPPGGSGGGAQPGRARVSRRVDKLGHRRDGLQQPLPLLCNQCRLRWHGQSFFQRQKLSEACGDFISPDCSPGKMQKCKRVKKKFNVTFQMQYLHFSKK